MTTPAASPVTAAHASASDAGVKPRSWRPGMPWMPAALVLAGGLLLGDSLHGSFSGAVVVAAAAGGLWWLSRGKAKIQPRLPSSWSGWIERCDGLLNQFERLQPTENDPAVSAQQEGRRQHLQQLRDRQSRQQLHVGLAGVSLPPVSLQPELIRALKAPLPLCLHWGHPLPSHSPDWRWPLLFQRCDLLLVHLETPLRAADLRWLESLPRGQAVFLLVSSCVPAPRPELEQELRAQLPGSLADQVILWSGEEEQLSAALEPCSRMLRARGRGLLLQTELRCLETLHAEWQIKLEGLRRERLDGLVRRTQWLVAAGVFAAPMPSVDVLVLAVANGLMLKEMAELWDCPWQLAQLREAATELAKAALALGVTEWTSQALLAAMRLEGTTWLVGGALQALSAAYLTRVVAHAMADVLALSSGVPELDLQTLRQQAPLLVARAAEVERLDWKGFLSQGQAWWHSQVSPGLGSAG
ncbi:MULTISPECIES: YcjF family protein [unclassified Synechococcus]|uniref:YcjF family protein n=1 Tax=unclassified Synechococcus TaxID=2626047 RepID=UPI001E4FA42C|nr:MULTISPECIES: YcjF family protein [unclassified Synechococcus]WFN58424.1 YcjF family protein [Synechococcus sp. CCFWC 502]